MDLENMDAGFWEYIPEGFPDPFKPFKNEIEKEVDNKLLSTSNDSIGLDQILYHHNNEKPLNEITLEASPNSSSSTASINETLLDEALMFNFTESQTFSDSQKNLTYELFDFSNVPSDLGDFQTPDPICETQNLISSNSIALNSQKETNYSQPIVQNCQSTAFNVENSLAESIDFQISSSMERDASCNLSSLSSPSEKLIARKDLRRKMRMEKNNEASRKYRARKQQDCLTLSKQVKHQKEINKNLKNRLTEMKIDKKFTMVLYKSLLQLKLLNCKHEFRKELKQFVGFYSEALVQKDTVSEKVCRYINEIFKELLLKHYDTHEQNEMFLWLVEEFFGDIKWLVKNFYGDTHIR